MNSKIIVRILIVGLTTVLALISFSKRDFLKDASADFTVNSLKY